MIKFHGIKKAFNEHDFQVIKVAPFSHMESNSNIAFSYNEEGPALNIGFTVRTNFSCLTNISIPNLGSEDIKELGLLLLELSNKVKERE